MGKFYVRERTVTAEIQRGGGGVGVGWGQVQNFNPFQKLLESFPSLFSKPVRTRRRAFS